MDTEEKVDSLYFEFEIENDNDNFDSLTNDILFKESFANRHNRKALEHLLEDYYDYPSGYLNGKLAVNYESHLEKTRLKDKSMRGDLIVIIDNSIMVNIEMYSTFTKTSLKKSKSYIMRIYSTQLDNGENYNNIKKVTQINFVDNVKFKIKEEVITTDYTFNKDLSDDYRMDIVRLDLIDKKGYNLSDKFKRQLKFLSAKSYEERVSIAKGDDILMEFNEWLEQYKNDESLRKLFDEKKWARIDGLEEGREERNIEIAKNLLAESAPIDLIIKVTGLTLEEINNIQQEN